MIKECLGSTYIYLVTMFIDFFLKTDIFHKCFQKNIRTLKKKKKVIRYTAENLRVSSNNSDESDKK